MRSPIPRFLRWTVVGAVIAALTVAVFQYWNTTRFGSTTAQPEFTQTAWGPLGPADRDVLIKVRQAGLWEGPTGQQAQQQGSSARVREVGGLISAEHADLDNQVREVAARLGVPLPNQPSEQQQAWMAEIAGQTDSEFDRTFVQRLRAAHGKVLPILATVRAETRNDQIRAFTTTAAEFVTRHHEYLESTGLVDYAALSEPQVPAGPALPAGGSPGAAAAVPSAVAAVPPVSHEQQHISPVAQATTDGGGGFYLAAFVYIASLLAIVGLLCVLGVAGLRSRNQRRTRQASHAPRNIPARPRHAAQRW
ncbi:MAG: DUF4142 domain-containing protein [Pseudonocardiaceae bacterium]